MLADSANLAIVKYNYHIGIFDCRKTLRNNEYGHVIRVRLYRPSECGIRSKVKGG